MALSVLGGFPFSLVPLRDVGCSGGLRHFSARDTSAGRSFNGKLEDSIRSDGRYKGSAYHVFFGDMEVVEDDDAEFVGIGVLLVGAGVGVDDDNGSGGSCLCGFGIYFGAVVVLLDIEVVGIDMGVGTVREGIVSGKDDFVVVVLLLIGVAVFGEDSLLFGCGEKSGIVGCQLLLMSLLFLFGTGILKEEDNGECKLFSLKTARAKRKDGRNLYNFDLSFCLGSQLYIRGPRLYGHVLAIRMTSVPLSWRIGSAAPFSRFVCTSSVLKCQHALATLVRVNTANGGGLVPPNFHSCHFYGQDFLL